MDSTWPPSVVVPFGWGDPAFGRVAFLPRTQATEIWSVTPVGMQPWAGADFLQDGRPVEPAEVMRRKTDADSEQDGRRDFEEEISEKKAGTHRYSFVVLAGRTQGEACSRFV